MAGIRAPVWSLKVVVLAILDCGIVVDCGCSRRVACARRFADVVRRDREAEDANILKYRRCNGRLHAQFLKCAHRHGALGFIEKPRVR
jgi:hypothetical protein